MNKIIFFLFPLNYLAFLHQQILKACNLPGEKAETSRSTDLGLQTKHVC